MATYLPYNDSVFLFRLQTLIIDGGTEVVRNIFNNRLKNLPLVTVLATEKTTINRLRAQKTITKVQYDKLFPPGGQNPDSGDFDITILMCLLRSIPSLGLNMTYPWHTSPRPTDTSVEADLIRLRTFRNEIAHASSTHCLDEPTYKQQWTKVEQCLIRLNRGSHADPNLQTTIDSFMNSPLDPATEQRLDKQWKDLENSLQSEINMIQENVIYNRKEIGEVARDVGEMKGGIERLEGRVDNLEGQFQNLDTKLPSNQQGSKDVSPEESAQDEGSALDNIQAIPDNDEMFSKVLNETAGLGERTRNMNSKLDAIMQMLNGSKGDDHQTHIEGAQDEGSGSISECGRNRVRDLKGEENTSERNWKMLEKVRQKEDAGRMAGQLRLDEERHKNWVRGATGLKFLHEGLKDMVCTTSRNHRDRELQNILSTLSPPSSATQCSLCTSHNLLPEHAFLADRPCKSKRCLQWGGPSKCFGRKPTNRRPCPNGICSKLYDGIVRAHQYKSPMWRNTDPTTWCSDIQGWSFGGKCYMTTPNLGKSADETDAAGLLSIILNNRNFQADIACNLAAPGNSFATARAIRNNILHSPKMELEDLQLQIYLDVFINVLQDKKKLFNDAKAKESVNKLVELKNNQITISISEEISLIQMRKDALFALEPLQEKETEVIKSLEEENTEMLVDRAVASAITLKWNDLHMILEETEEAMAILTETVQQKKSLNSDAQKEGSGALNDCKRIIAKGWTTLVNYIKPKPLLDCAVECELFNYRTVRDLKEEKNTSNRNRIILEKVGQRGVAGLNKFKECLKKSRQTKLADFVDLIEKGMDTDEIKRQIAEEASLHDAQKEGSGALNDCKRIIAKGWTTLVNYIKPKPLLDCAVECELFNYRTVRDLKEEKTNTSHRNRIILEKVGQRGVAGLNKFKECLKKSRQTKLADFVDLIEKGMDTDEIKRQIAEEASLHELHEVLIEKYRSDHSEMYLVPHLNKGTPLLQFYQMPDLEHVTENIEIGRAAKEERTPIDTWDKLFHDSNYASHRSIYICADAGLGKTAFSQYLALAWCQSKKSLQEESQFFKLEQLDAIGKFRYVFLLFLRESQKSNLCHLKDMIWHQLVSKLLCSYEIKDLENILRNEKCLIILDGLDEWTHPEKDCGKREQVPHWSKRENVAVITTTRPWKFSVAGLKSGPIDHRIELTGLNQNSAYNLKYSFMSYFKMQNLSVKCLGQQDKDEVSRNVQKFTKTVSDKHATKLESVPLMLMYMLFLYLGGFNLGETKCDLYCQIIELLLSRTFEEKQESVTSTTEKIPLCFNKLKQCLKFYNPYLKPLGELAFRTLLEENREENTLVFDSSVAIKCLGEECFKQCLKIGIISQSKCVQTHPLSQESTVSFSHKTMQEFFAALYMYSAPDDTRMSQLVLSKCKNVQDILDMSKIMMFISGMNGNIAALISGGMMDIINEYETTQKYRNTTEIVGYGTPLKDLQDMFVSCCKEMQCASGDNLYIQDVFIDRDCQDEQYRVNLKQLIQHNKNNIKSVFINMSHMEDTPYNSVQKVVEYFALKDLKNIVKIFCLYVEDTENIIPVLNTQVKCLELARGSWSRSLCEKVTSLQKLEVIVIRVFTISHSELRLLYDFISQKVDMRQIELWDLECSDLERSSCSGVSLDLSQHSQLRKLSLHRGIPLSELNINMTSLAWCELESLSLSSLVFTHGSCDTVNSELNKSDVRLLGVTIPASVLKDLVTVIPTLPHTVCVLIVDCDIKPESEWETLKRRIKTSPLFTVLEEEVGKSLHFTVLDDYNWCRFKFETWKLNL